MGKEKMILLIHSASGQNQKPIKRIRRQNGRENRIRKFKKQNSRLEAKKKKNKTNKKIKFSRKINAIFFFLLFLYFIIWKVIANEPHCVVAIKRKNRSQSYYYEKLIVKQSFKSLKILNDLTVRLKKLIYFPNPQI